MMKKTIYTVFVKRLFDIIISLCFMIVFSWLYLILIILVAAILGRPVFFGQMRPGKRSRKTGKEKIFKLYKFRTMTNATDENGELLPNEQRMTRFGNFLRASSLDELPEMWNILKGDMSLIGPRPLLVKYLPRYSKEQRHRHDLRPGLTGYAQTNGRNAISWEEKFKLDVYYTRHVSLALDLEILFTTVYKVFKREGINAAENVTMTEFMGTEQEELSDEKD